MTENTRSGRRPIQVVQIDQDVCSRSYGVAPCAAELNNGGRKCFNTIGTCQDLTNYDADVLTLNFIDNQSVIPNDGNYYFPFLKSAKVSPGKINPGGGNKSASALGQRASLSISLNDAPHSDRIVDKYVDERISGAAQDDGIGYDPFERSTFWVKWKARNKYYLHRPVRLISGYLKDGQIVDSITRSFFLTGMSGPTAKGGVTFTAKDVLTLINDDKAKAPAQSEGKLFANINNSVTTATLSPVGIGDLDYPASGWVRISDEVCSFTRAVDVLTIIRGQFNTSGKEHEAGDTVQLCLRYDGARPDDILNDLLSNYSGIAAQYLDVSGWAVEVDSYMPRLYSAIITEPVGVKKLISEMCEQMYFYTWFDERNDLVKLRAVRPADGETVTALDGDRHIIQDSMSVADATDQLITQVWVNYAQLDPTKKLDEISNYAATEIIGDFEEEHENRQGSSKIKTIYSRWITAANGASAIDLGEKILARYSNVPKKMTFALDAKDRDIWVGDFVQIKTRIVADDVGEQRPVNLQIMAASESKVGTIFTYSGQEFVNETPPDPNDRLIIISADLTNVNLRELHDSLYPAPVGTEKVRVVVRSGVMIRGAVDPIYQGWAGEIKYIKGIGVVTASGGIFGAFQTNAVTTPTFFPALSVSPLGTSGMDMINDVWLVPRAIAIDTGLWPVGVTLSLDCESGSHVIGAGGDGSALHAEKRYLPPRDTKTIGSDGGDALNVQHPIQITNMGMISGGGGAGAPAVLIGHPESHPTTIAHAEFVPSGGGAGEGESVGGLSGFGSAFNYIFDSASPNPSSGSAFNKGYGGRINFRFAGGYNYPGSFLYKTISSGDGGGLALNGATSSSTGYPLVLEVDPGGGPMNDPPIFIDIPAPVGVGGTAGAAIKSGANLVTWINKGDVRGVENA